MNDKLKISFPEVKLYWIVIFIFCLIITYFDKSIGIFSLGILGYLIFYNSKVIQSKNNNFLVDLKNLSIDMDELSKQAMLDFPVPFCIINSHGKIKWNNLKLSDALNNDELIDQNLSDVINISLKDILPTNDDNYKVYEDYFNNNRHYHIQVSNISQNIKSPKYAVYFFDTSEKFALIEQYKDIKPVISLIQIDNFDEVLESAADEFKPLLEADIERRIRFWLEKKDGIFAKLSKNKYFCMFREPMLKEIELEKFNILDDVRDIELSNSIPVTLSVGLSTYDNSLMETYKNAISSLQMALGRGGDQAVCKIYEKTLFYGGKSKAIEKKTKVRARIIGQSMKDLIEKSSNVLVMGHQYPDLDSMGSCMGIVSICKILEKPVKIVLSSPNESMDELYKKIISTDGYEDIFISHDHANQLCTKETVLIVVDTHKGSITEMPSLVDNIDKVMLIDHHRRGIEFIEKAVLTYHETYVSSASEMVTELIQYVKENAKIDTIVAESLLAGITLDTRNFALNTGVRTFEAAAFLRKNGADPIYIKKFFQGDFDSFLLRAHCIQNAKIIDDIIAISSYEEKLETPSLAASKIADELLNIKGVKASFVIIEGINEVVQVSARSLEDINVQVIMEKLGGGGHIDTAATQIKDKNLSEVIQLVEDTVKLYLEDEYSPKE